ncbi:MAG: 50S ribosomal protein L22 [Prevotellaceae bacterium]|jgi:large subunit ribosomal protein L22|nr:50S ribosomal protein L22 [Prevotellaceae bacterium]
MGQRKHISATTRKEAKRTLFFARLKDVPTSPRKMRYVADMIRGLDVNRALGVLKFSNKEASAKMEKLLKSAISNWEQKSERRADNVNLYVSEVYVDSATMLKRLRTAPQGRGYRIRKRSNHVTLYVNERTQNTNDNEQKTIINGTEN